MKIKLEEIDDIFWCDKRRKCQWKVFALETSGFAIGKIENSLSAWRKAHDEYCGGKLIQGKIMRLTQ